MAGRARRPRSRDIDPRPGTAAPVATDTASGVQRHITSPRRDHAAAGGANHSRGLPFLESAPFSGVPPDRIISSYTALVRRAANAFEMANVLVSWLLGATYDAYVVIGCAKRDTCLGIRYRSLCPDLPSDAEEVSQDTEPEEEPRYKLVPLPDFTSKYVTMMENRAIEKKQAELDRIEAERQMKIAELEKPPPDAIDGWRTHAWVLVLPGPMDIEEPFFIEPQEGNGYPLDAEQYQQIDAVYNNENYYVNLQVLRELEEEEWSETDMFERELQKEKEKAEVEKGREEKEKEELEKRERKKAEKAEKKRKEQEEQEKKEKSTADVSDKEKKDKEKEERKKEKKEKKKKEKEEAEQRAKEAKEEEEKDKEKNVWETAEEEEERTIIWQNLSHLRYDLSDITCWEHLLPGEPANRRNLPGVDITRKKTARDTEKHLDMPESWVEKLDISAADYMQRYPGCHKVIHYKKVLLEKFSRYSQASGIVKRIKIFQDYALTIPLITYEYFKNREDKMHIVKIDHTTNEVEELFETGRPENLIKHTYSIDAPVTSVEGNRSLEFKWFSRIDHLQKIDCTPLSFDEYYVDREDLLISRHIKYVEGNKLEPKRRLHTVTEVYQRNYDVPAKEDVWQRIFHIHNNTIQLLYHYEYNFVTNDTRSFVKPNLAETGGKVLFYADKTSGYIADPCGYPTRPLDIYFSLCNNIDWEYRTTKHIRDRETDVNGYLMQRHKEITEPTLYVSLFNTERNEEAQKAYAEMEKQKAEIAEREREADIDPLQPYLARMFGTPRGITQPLTVKEATIIREQCINDFRTKQLARQIIVQERFDKMNAEYKAKRLWYLANQFILTPEKEAAYFAMSAELSFQVHSLEVRLTRHQDLSAPRFRALEVYLNKHPLLKEYNRMRAYYKVKQ
ncbi:dynein regulatory complex subunit 7 [Pectinophora gossypiella]|nr:dynein regulatory complex subunit 7 [Pectinophora gossypiella]